MIEKRIYCEVFCMCFIVSITSDIEAIKKKYNVNYNGSGACALLNESTILIVFNRKVKDVIIHEIDHAIDFCFQARAIRKRPGVDETHALMMQWLYDKIIMFVKKNGYKI